MRIYILIAACIFAVSSASAHDAQDKAVTTLNTYARNLLDEAAAEGLHVVVNDDPPPQWANIQLTRYQKAKLRYIRTKYAVYNTRNKHRESAELEAMLTPAQKKAVANK
jgi:Spy/CpxP family protein refolding chaperone